MIASYHNHTRWSDGKSDVDAMLAFAEENRVDVLGISDHFCVTPDGSKRKWSITESEVFEYVSAIRQLRERTAPAVVVGLEIDWFANHSGILQPILDRLNLDYRIGSLHHVDEVFFLESFSPERSEEELRETWRNYWLLEQSMAESGLFDIVAHLDFPKRMGFFPEAEMESDINHALDAIAANNLVVELNTAGYAQSFDEAYPSPGILKKCRERDIPITLSADAHQPDRILYEFKRGLETLREAGYSEVARFSERTVTFESLDEALKSR